MQSKIDFLTKFFGGADMWGEHFNQPEEDLQEYNAAVENVFLKIVPFARLIGRLSHSNQIRENSSSDLINGF